MLLLSVMSDVSDIWQRLEEAALNARKINESTGLQICSACVCLSVLCMANVSCDLQGIHTDNESCGATIDMSAATEESVEKISII